MDPECMLKVLLLLIMMYSILMRKSDRWLRREFVRRPMYQLRPILGFFKLQWEEMKADPEMLYQYIAMDLQTFQELLALLEVHLHKNHEAAICSEERLIIALR